MKFYPLIPFWLILLFGAAAIAAVWFTARYGMDISPRRRLILMILRLAAAATAIIMLLNPGFVTSELNRQRSNVIFLLDGSGSMNTSDMPGGKSRLEAAKSFLKYLENTDFSGCRKYSYVFSSRATPVESAAKLQTYVARGGTDLKRAFNTIDKDVGFSRTAAVILLSDGLDHSGFAGVHAGLPVFAVRFGSEMNDVPDLRLNPFQAPDSLRTNEEMNMSIPVALTGFKEPETAELKIIVDGKPEKTENFGLKPGEDKIIEFRHSFAAPGIHIVQLKLNRLPDEAGYLNNERESAIEVKEGKNSTVCYFPVLNNSFRPLVRLLHVSGKKFTALYKLKADNYSLTGTDIDPAFKHGIPATSDAMKQSDVFVLGSNREGLLSDAESATLEQYVSNGGNLILLGG
ncbi:MAG: vWA domain-containing protein, partial [Victivallaceae bacterium]